MNVDGYEWHCRFSLSMCGCTMPSPVDWSRVKHLDRLLVFDYAVLACVPSARKDFSVSLLVPVNGRCGKSAMTEQRSSLLLHRVLSRECFTIDLFCNNVDSCLNYINNR